MEIAGTNIEVTKVYDDVVGTKAQLFLKTNEWMVSTFKNADSVIQYSDKDEGVIIGKYLMAGQILFGSYKVDERVFAILEVHVKDGKIKISIKPVPWNYVPAGSIGFGLVDGSTFSETDFNNEAEKLVNDFHNALKINSTEF